MSYGYRNCYQALSLETCHYSECSSSKIHFITYVKKYEEDNNVDGDIREHCKQWVDKKHGTCEVMSVGEAIEHQQ